MKGFPYSRELKYKKQHRRTLPLVERRGSSSQLFFGDFGLRSLESGFITPHQIEAIRRVCVTQTRRRGRTWIRLISDIPRTKKSLGARMGAGKGPFKYCVSGVSAGSIIIEFGVIDYKLILKIAKIAAARTSLRLGLVVRYGRNWFRN